MTRRRAARYLLLLLAGAATAAETRRQDAVLTAYAFADHSAGAAIRLDPRNDAGDDPALLPDLARALEQRGHRVDPTAALVLSFDLAPEDDVTLPGYATPSQNLVMPLGAARVELGSDVSLHIRMSVPLGATQDARSQPGLRAALYRLSVELDDRDAKRRVWSADLLFAADQRRHLDVARALLPVLFDNLGRSVDRLGIAFD